MNSITCRPGFTRIPTRFLDGTIKLNDAEFKVILGMYRIDQKDGQPTGRPSLLDVWTWTGLDERRFKDAFFSLMRRNLLSDFDRRLEDQP